jgi:hypothetical protein
MTRIEIEEIKGDADVTKDVSSETSQPSSSNDTK